jgi:hypothetical protein
MNWQLVSSVVGLITGVISLLGLIYVLGWRLGRISLKVDLLWKVYIEEALISLERSSDNLNSNNGEIFPEEMAIKIRDVLRKRGVKKKGFEEKIISVIERIRLEDLKALSGEGSTKRLIGRIALFVRYYERSLDRN